MAAIYMDPEQSLLLLIDLQKPFLQTVHESERVLGRATYLARVAIDLGIPVLATAQNPSRLGAVSESLTQLGLDVLEKMCFSCWKELSVRAAIKNTRRSQIVLSGVETHICVGLTANDLLEQGYEVAVCPDAVSSSSIERHKLGMERIRDAGGVPVHTEAMAYEWVQSAESEKFRPILKLTKEFS